ncbi:MAG TPA: hypothetical protein VMF57_00400 [Solirubrobacteraceae bacterium]|nr:hypothetical protein [Solirubrobacteraceae bacterium]
MIAAAYVIVSPASEDLAAHLLRAKLFATEGFGIWNNWWYGGHNVPGYSVLFPPLGALLTPQAAGAIAIVPTAALFEALARRRFGEQAWLGALWFGAATSTSLFTGRLTFAFGLLPAVASALALQRRRPGTAAALAALTALASPVDAVFAALAGAAQAAGAYLEHRELRGALPGLGVIVAAAAPVLALAIAFPEGGYEPFAFSALWPLVLISAAFVFVTPREEPTLRMGAALYGIGCVLSFAVASPIGSNVTRLGPLIAGPLLALLWWPRRRVALAVLAIPLLYLQWQAPVRDERTADDNVAVTDAYYQPVISYLSRQTGPPFRIEIPFTPFHWEAYRIAPRFPLARGWERQLDTKYNALFYNGTLTPASYDAWLRQLAVRFIAVPRTTVDYAAADEVRLINRGLPYLRLVDRTANWRIYAVTDATPIVQGPATLRGLGPNWLQLRASRPGTSLIRVRWSPYWAVTQGSGCVAAAGGFTQLRVRRPGPVRVAIRFSLTRIGARTPRCS